MLAIFYWPKVKFDVELFVTKCDTCQCNEVETIPYLDLLQPYFYGSYWVRVMVGEAMFALDIPNKGRLYDVFHISCLNKFGDDVVIQIEIPLTYEEGTLVLEHEGILDEQMQNLCSIKCKVHD
jgi:hypothetical protein